MREDYCRYCQSFDVTWEDEWQPLGSSQSSKKVPRSQDEQVRCDFGWYTRHYSWLTSPLYVGSHSSCCVYQRKSCRASCQRVEDCLPRYNRAGGTSNVELALECDNVLSTAQLFIHVEIPQCAGDLDLRQSRSSCDSSISCSDRIWDPISSQSGICVCVVGRFEDLWTEMCLILSIRFSCLLQTSQFPVEQWSHVLR